MTESRRTGRGSLPVQPLAGLSWLLLLTVTTAMLWALRDTFDKAHMALAYLLLVLAVSARHGRGLGLVIAFLAFLAFNFFLLSPYHTFAVENPVDWLVLAAFLITSGVAAQLLYRSQHEAAIARLRADEMNRLSTLGAETLSMGGTESAVEAIARVVQSTLRIALCEVYQLSSEGEELRRVAAVSARRAPVAAPPVVDLVAVARRGGVAAQRPDGSVGSTGESAPIDQALSRLWGERVILIPLHVRGRVVGLLRLTDDAPIGLDPAQARFTAVLSYYAALGVERVRLVAEEERASALREADRLKDALLASISHDLRTPLTTIRALAEEIAAGADPRAAVIEEEARRLASLVEDVLDLGRLDAHALPVSLEIVPVEDLVGAVLRRASGMPGASRLVTDLPPGPLLAVRVDFSHSLRVLSNLVENALKYSPTDHAVEIRARATGERVHIDVLDRGPGVEHAGATRIFEPYYRHSSGVPDAGGTGLGLAIARRLAEAQGGSLHYTPRPGGGSIFSLIAPRVELAGSPAAESAESLPDAPGHVRERRSR